MFSGILGLKWSMGFEGVIQLYKKIADRQSLGWTSMNRRKIMTDKKSSLENDQYI